MGAATEPERDRIENEMNKSYKKERVRTLGNIRIYTHKSKFFLEGNVTRYFFEGWGYVCCAWAKNPNIEFILCKKNKKKKKRWPVGQTHPTPASTYKLGGSNFFYGLKISIYPYQKIQVMRLTWQIQHILSTLKQSHWR